jgi:hypothetical protein
LKQTYDQAGHTQPGDNPPDATGFSGISTKAVSLFDVNFEATSTGLYDLDAEVSWVGMPPPYSGFAKVELVNGTDRLKVD